jgi:hypothetical protein
MLQRDLATDEECGGAGVMTLLRPGRAWLRLRQKYGKGLRVAWYRDVVRPRIVESAPVPGTSDATRVEVHVLTSAGDWLNLCWVLKSFYHFANVKWALCIHEDGSVPPDGIAALGRLFPDARLVRRAEADATVLPMLDGGGFGRCADLRRTNVLSLKVFDFAHYLAAPRMLLLDSDVLFFARPDVLIERALDPEWPVNTVNGDLDSAYTVDRIEAGKRIGCEVAERFNSGLGVIHRESLRLEWIEEFLALPGIIGKAWRIEQTLLALASSRFGCELLPAEYDVFVDGETGDRPSRHYIGAIRHRMYGEGIARLAGVLGA